MTKSNKLPATTDVVATGTPPQQPTPTEPPPSLLEPLGIVGFESIEPIIFASLIGGDPLLLIGPHGSTTSAASSAIAKRSDRYCLFDRRVVWGGQSRKRLATFYLYAYY